MEGYSRNPADYYGLWDPDSNEDPSRYFRPKGEDEARLQALLAAPSRNPADYWVSPEEAAASSSRGHVSGKSRGTGNSGGRSNGSKRSAASDNLEPHYLPRPGSQDPGYNTPEALRTQDFGLGWVGENTTVASMTMERSEAPAPASTDEYRRDAGEKPPRPGSVATLSIDIQRGFRIKMFSILLVQQIFTVVLTILLLSIPDARDVRPLPRPAIAAVPVSLFVPVLPLHRPHSHP